MTTLAHDCADTCGTRCDECDDRMCSEYGPEPATGYCISHQCCTSCARTDTRRPACSECQRALNEAREGSDW